MKNGKLLISTGVIVYLTTIFSVCTYADDVQDGFLKDMAAGLKARWAITDSLGDETLPTDEEIETRNRYLDAELKYIEKYKEEDFSNTRLDFLAKTYIDGVEMQKNALQYYEDYNVIFDSQWSAGYTTRAVALCDIYDYYGLDIDQENVDEMRSVATPGYTYEIVSSNDDVGIEVDEKLIEIIEAEAIDRGYGYLELYYKIKNISDVTLDNILLTVTELDENNDISGTTYLYSDSNLEPGQSVTLNGGTVSKEQPTVLKVEEISCSGGDVSYKQNTFDGSGDFLTCLVEEILDASKEVQTASDNDIEIFNNEGITISIGNMERLSYGAYRIHIHAENLNHHNIIISTEDYKAVINGKMINSSLQGEVQSGKTASINWDIYDNDLADAGIEKIESISFKVMISDASNYSKLYTGEEKFFNVTEDNTITPREVYNDKEHIRQVQELLNKLGYECGSADGVPGKLTNSCILAFEKDHGLNEATEITPELIAALEKAANSQ